jgi:putative membrane protein (TIGR04086 family)
MNVRWMGVLIGFAVDFLISAIIGLFASPTFGETPDITRPDDLALLILLTLSTGVGGYVAGRMAERDRALNGLLVGVVGILFAQLQLLGSDIVLPRIFVVQALAACLCGALGGYLARFPAVRRSGSPNR